MDNKNDEGEFNAALPISTDTDDEVQRVEAEPLEGGPNEQPNAFREPDNAAGGMFMGPGGRIHVFQARMNMGQQGLKAPVLATWICLIIGWFFLGSKVLFTVILGIPFVLAALLLAAVCLSRGAILTPLLVFILGTAGSLAMYLIGWFRLLVQG